MDDPVAETQAGLPLGAGERLRAARVGRGLTLEQVAAQTRIPKRQLVMLEAGDFAGLPGRTYALGFSRTYAKLVGLDDDEIAAQVRAELNVGEYDPQGRPASFEPGDPARVPSRMLGWLSVLAVVLVLAGLFAFFRPYFSPAAQLPSLIEQQQAGSREAQANRPLAGTPVTAAAAANGPVVFTATAERVWVKFSDAGGKQLMQKELALDESYTVPPDAAGPTLWTGRPEALAITVGGRPVPRLSDTQKIMKDVPVTPQALLERNAPSAVGPSQAAPVPSPSPTA